MTVDITLRIGGQAGQGMQSIGYIMGKIFTRHGYYIFTNQDVESRIRGGHSFVQTRINNEPVHAISDNVDIMIALDRGTIEQDLSVLAQDGVMISNVSLPSKFRSGVSGLPMKSLRLSSSSSVI